MNKNIRPAFMAQIDQDRTKARDWLSTVPGDVIMDLIDRLVDEDPAELIAWMARDGQIADCVQRLAKLSLDQAVSDLCETQLQIKRGIA